MTTLLTLKRSRGLIVELEGQIEKALQEFHDNTGLCIYDLSLSETDVTTLGDDHKSFFYRVKMEVRL